MFMHDTVTTWGERPIGLLAGCLTGRDPSSEQVLGDWIYRGVVTATLVIVTCSYLDGTGMVFSLLPRTGSSRHCCILANWH